MDYLIKKSDATAASQGRTINKIKLPEQTGGDVTFPGDKRPVDLGDYILVEAAEITETLNAAQKYGEKTVDVDVAAQTVTVTRPAVAKDAADLLQDVIDARLAPIADGGYGTLGGQFEILGEQGIGPYQKHIADVKAANPKGGI